MSRRRTPATTPTGGKDGPRFGNPAMEEPFDLVRSTSTTFRVLVVGMVLFIACLLCVAPWGNATLRRTLEEHKAAIDALVQQNTEMQAHARELEAKLGDAQGTSSSSSSTRERNLRARQAMLQQEIKKLNAKFVAMNETVVHRPNRPSSLATPATPAAVPNGLILLDVRKNGPVRNEQAMAWLMNVRRTTHGVVPVEFWIGPSTQIKPWLQAFVDSNAAWITVRRFPVQGDFPKSMRMPPSMALDDAIGGHIGKAYALAESAFSFPVFLDTDVFMCLGWWEKMMQLTAEHPDGDVFWTEDDPYDHDSFESTSNIRTAYVSKEEIDPVRDEYAKFAERNGGTFIAVRKSPGTRNFLIDALNIVRHARAPHTLTPHDIRPISIAALH